MSNPPLVKLCALRKKHGISIREMAKKLNISKSMYSYIERGEKRLSYDMAASISDIFKLTPDELFFDDFRDFYN